MDVFESRQNLYVVMELLTGGELFERIVGRCLLLLLLILPRDVVYFDTLIVRNGGQHELTHELTYKSHLQTSHTGVDLLSLSVGVSFVPSLTVWLISTGSASYTET